jgi:hypothetical protein
MLLISALSLSILLETCSAGSSAGRDSALPPLTAPRPQAEYANGLSLAEYSSYFDESSGKRRGRASPLIELPTIENGRLIRTDYKEPEEEPRVLPQPNVNGYDSEDDDSEDEDGYTPPPSSPFQKTYGSKPMAESSLKQFRKQKATLPPAPVPTIR